MQRALNGTTFSNADVFLSRPRCVFMKSGMWRGGEWENSGLVNLVQERTLGTRLRSCERLCEVWARFLERWLILTQD